MVMLLCPAEDLAGSGLGQIVHEIDGAGVGKYGDLLTDNGEASTRVHYI